MTEARGTAPRRPRRHLGWLLLVAFVVVPIVEIYVIIQVGQVIGAWWTVLLLIADSIFGSWLIKREGGRAWTALRTAINSGRMPARELADGALILVGGTLMLSPGFVTDAFGIVMILPFTRPIARRFLTGVLARRLVVLPDLGAMGGPLGSKPDDHRPGDAAGRDTRPGPVVRGEVVDDDE